MILLWRSRFCGVFKGKLFFKQVLKRSLCSAFASCLPSCLFGVLADGHRGGREEGREPPSPRRSDYRDSPVHYSSSSRDSKWERFGHRDRYESHSGSFRDRERRRYPDSNPSFDSPRSRGDIDGGRGGGRPSAKRPSRRDSPGRNSHRPLKLPAGSDSKRL